MERSIQLAELGRGRVSPNPMVGACVVKEGHLISNGYHDLFGGPHAEVYAMRKAGSRAKGATLYVTLEPCSTFGKTPPCIDAIIKSGVKEVVIGALDPNPKHHKNGIALLKKAGIQVIAEVLSEKIIKQNEAFFTYHKRKRPFIVLKMAESLDGKITTYNRSKEWISSAESRKWTHRLRQEMDAIMVGTRTVEVDNPWLTPYLAKFKKSNYPLRVVMDRDLKLKRSCHVFGNEASTLVFTSEKNSLKSRQEYGKARNVALVEISEKNKKLDLREAIKKLYSIGITSLLIEGGGELSASMLELGIVDKVYMIIAPFFLGGRTTVTSVEGTGIASVKQAIRIKEIKTSRLGEDILVEGYVK